RSKLVEQQPERHTKPADADPLPKYVVDAPSCFGPGFGALGRGWRWQRLKNIDRDQRADEGQRYRSTSDQAGWPLAADEQRVNQKAQQWEGWNQPDDPGQVRHLCSSEQR